MKNKSNAKTPRKPPHTTHDTMLESRVYEECENCKKYIYIKYIYIIYIFFNMFYERSLKGNGSRQAGSRWFINSSKSALHFWLYCCCPGNSLALPHPLSAPATVINLTRVATAWLFRAISVSSLPMGMVTAAGWYCRFFSSLHTSAHKLLILLSA